MHLIHVKTGQSVLMASTNSIAAASLDLLALCVKWVSAFHKQQKETLLNWLFKFFYCHAHYYRPQRSCGKVMFLHLSVSHSVDRGVSAGINPPGRYTPGRYISRQVHPWAGTPPGRYTPRQVHPLGRYTHRQAHPARQVHPTDRYTPWTGIPRQVHPPDSYTPGQVHPQAGTPPLRQYASYCNVFLSFFCEQRCHNVMSRFLTLISHSVCCLSYFIG